MEKITEALKKLLPESEVKEVEVAVNEMFEEAKASLEAEYNQKLEEAYTELANEAEEAKKKAEKVSEAGYAEAYEIINDLRNRLEVQGEEYKSALEEGYEEAFQMLKKERDKNQQHEVEMYEEYDKKLAEMKEYIVDKVDQFLQFKTPEMYEQVKRELLNEPRMLEHKVVLDRIVDLTSGYLSDDNFNSVSSSKLEEASKAIEEMKGQLKLMEARNIRISTENTKLNEQVRQSQEYFTESRKLAKQVKKAEIVNEQKERTEKAKSVTGRGNGSTNEIISEYAAPTNDEADTLLVLSGLKQA